MAHVARVLRPGGRLHLAVPNVRWRDFGLTWRHLRCPQHLYYFDVLSLERLLQAAGMAVQACDDGEIICLVAVK